MHGRSGNAKKHHVKEGETSISPLALRSYTGRLKLFPPLFSQPICQSDAFDFISSKICRMGNFRLMVKG